MVKRNTDKRFSRWRVISAQLMLIWFVLRSVMVIAMPVISPHGCCLGEGQPVTQQHHVSALSHKHMACNVSLQGADSDEVSTSVEHHDHAACDHCPAGCQLVASSATHLHHNADAFKHVSYPIFFFPSSSLDLPFRPPMA